MKGAIYSADFARAVVMLLEKENIHYDIFNISRFGVQFLALKY